MALVVTANAEAGKPVRAYYWDVGDKSTLSPATDAGRIARLKSLGISEAHIWLNENRKTPPCGYLFHYTEGGAPLWTASRLEAFTVALKAAGLRPVYILSPDIRTTSYIASLSAVGGPLAVAAKVGDVDIELDIEGNGQNPGETEASANDPAAVACADGLTRDAADAAIVAAVRATSPTSRLVISTIRGYDAKHPVLTAAANAISPQLYGAHYAYTLKEATEGLAYFRKRYPDKPLWLALSVECSPADAAAARCSETLFASEVELATKAWAVDPVLSPKYVVWGEREARACPPKPLCSVFAETYLSKTGPQRADEARQD